MGLIGRVTKKLWHPFTQEVILLSCLGKVNDGILPLLDSFDGLPPTDRVRLKAVSDDASPELYPSRVYALR